MCAYPCECVCVTHVNIHVCLFVSMSICVHVCCMCVPVCMTGKVEVRWEVYRATWRHFTELALGAPRCHRAHLGMKLTVISGHLVLLD